MVLSIVLASGTIVNGNLILGYFLYLLVINCNPVRKFMPLTPYTYSNSSPISHRDSVSSPGSTNTSSSDYVTHVLDASFPGVIESCEYEVPDTPTIRKSCNLKWRIRNELGKGAGAVIFELSPGDKVARVTQLTTENQKQFYNDIAVRRHLDQLKEGVDTPRLLDSMICKPSNKIEFGITVSKKYKGDLEWYLLTQKTRKRRNEIMNTIKTKLPDMIKTLWQTYHIFHRDIHAKNILVDETNNSIKLRFIDFEKAQYIPLKLLRELAGKKFSELDPQKKRLLSECLLRDLSVLFDRYGMNEDELDKFNASVGNTFTWEKLDVAKPSTYPPDVAIGIWCQCALSGVERMIGLFDIEAEYQVHTLIQNLEKKLLAPKEEAKFD